MNSRTQAQTSILRPTIVLFFTITVLFGGELLAQHNAKTEAAPQSPRVYESVLYFESIIPGPVLSISEDLLKHTDQKSHAILEYHV